MLSLIFSHLHLSNKYIYTVLCLSRRNNKFRVFGGLWFGEEKTFFSMLTLCKKQILIVSYNFGQTNQDFTFRVVLILLGNTNGGLFLYITNQLF